MRGKVNSPWERIRVRCFKGSACEEEGRLGRPRVSRDTMPDADAE